MKKLLVIAMALLLVGAFSNTAKAYEGDFEMSGHINTGFGYQYNQTSATKPVGIYGGAFTEEGMIGVRSNTSNNAFIMYVGEVELDITKTFGENIRLRTDLDFIRANSYSYLQGFALNEMIEQAYVTVNIPVGYGLEFLMGRFNAPMGFEAVDNNDNDLPFHTMIFNYLRPQNLTGMKFYYPFSDLFDLHVWIANDLLDTGFNAQVAAGRYSWIPSFGTRLGLTWGMEGQESTVGLSGAFGPQATHTGASNDKWGDWTYLGDLDFNVWVNDVFAIGGEGIFRRDGAPKGTNSNYYFGGTLNMHYVFSDVWDGTLRYNYVFDKSVNGAATINGLAAASQFHRFQDLSTVLLPTPATRGSALNNKRQNHQIDLGINYHITDGAKLMAMYRFEYLMPSKSWSANKAMAHSVAANFAYEF